MITVDYKEGESLRSLVSKVKALTDSGEKSVRVRCEDSDLAIMIAVNGWGLTPVGCIRMGTTFLQAFRELGIPEGKFQYTNGSLNYVLI